MLAFFSKHLIGVALKNNFLCVSFLFSESWQSWDSKSRNLAYKSICSYHPSSAAWGVGGATGGMTYLDVSSGRDNYVSGR